MADGGAALVPSRDRDPSEGPQLFDWARLALVALDRLTHGARVGEIAGPSLQAEHTMHEPRSLRGVEVLTHPAPPFARPNAILGG